MTVRIFINGKQVPAEEIKNYTITNPRVKKLLLEAGTKKEAEKEEHGQCNPKFSQ